MFKSLVLPALLLAGAVCAPAAQAAPTIALSARCSDARVCAPTAALAVQVDEPLDGGSLSLAAPGLSLGHPTLTGPEGRQVLDCDGGFHYCRFGALSAGDHTLTVSARPADGQFELRASMAYVQGGDAGLTDAAPLSWTLSGAGGERFTGPDAARCRAAGGRRPHAAAAAAGTAALGRAAHGDRLGVGGR
jgi:hypothetical protein